MKKKTARHPKESGAKGIIFTPRKLVCDMLDMLKKQGSDVFHNAKKTILDGCCGNGRFLTETLKKRLNNGIPLVEALSTIYGVEIDPELAEETRQRLIGYDVNNTELRSIVDHNIICADFLDPNHSGWAKVGYMWSAD